MPQSHAQVWLHTVFSTKNRKAYLESPEFRDEMFRMLAYHVKEVGCVVAIVGGHVDHVHLLLGLSRTLKICKLVEVIKTETSKWAKNAKGGNREFAGWQAGYGSIFCQLFKLGRCEAVCRSPGTTPCQTQLSR